MLYCGCGALVGSRAVVRSHRTAGSGVCGAGKLRKTIRCDEISCIAHPYGRFAQIFHRGPSFRSLVGAHAAPYQLLVYRFVGSGQLLLRFRGRQTTEPEIGSSMYMPISFKAAFNLVGRLYRLYHPPQLTTQRCVYTLVRRSAHGVGWPPLLSVCTGAGRSAHGAGGAKYSCL